MDKTLSDISSLHSFYFTCVSVAFNFFLISRMLKFVFKSYFSFQRDAIQHICGTTVLDVCVSGELRRKDKALGASRWVTESVKWLTLGFCSGHDLRVVESSPGLSPTLSTESA